MTEHASRAQANPRWEPMMFLHAVLRCACAPARLRLPPPADGGGPAAGTESAGEALLRQVGQRYAAAHTLSAQFRQEIPLQNVGIVRKASGTVYFGRPLKMRWDYDGPEAQLFLADGRYFYFRPAGSSQVIRRGVDEKRLGGKIPLLLLFGKGEIATLFRVDAADPRKGGEETVLRLFPPWATGLRRSAGSTSSSARGTRSSARSTSSTGSAGRTIST